MIFIVNNCEFLLYFIIATLYLVLMTLLVLIYHNCDFVTVWGLPQLCFTFIWINGNCEKYVHIKCSVLCSFCFVIKNKAINDKASDLFLDLPVMTHLFEKTNH